jgi:valine--pyruvate aminotransferase
LPAARTGIIVADRPSSKLLPRSTRRLPPSTGPVIVEPLLRSGRLAAAILRPHYAAHSAAAVLALRAACAGLPLRIHRPEGAFFLWLWFPGLPIPSEELYRRLKQRDVLVLSGHHFFPGVEHESTHRHECLRLSYAQPPASVQAGIAILAEEVRRAYERG